MMRPRLLATLKSMAGRAVRSLPPRWQCRLTSLRSFERVAQGRGSFVHSSVQILGKKSIRIGTNSVLSQDTWLNVNHRETGAVAISIADNCFVGRRNFFSSGRLIELKDYVLTANDCHFLGSSHVVSNPMLPVIGTGTTHTATITIGINTFIGAGARVVGNVTVGHGCVIGAGATITKDVPPFSQVYGTPATVQKRFSVAQQVWVPQDQFLPDDESALPTESEYLALLAASGHVSMPYVAAGADLGNC